ncbi:HK97 family phage prohead protease [Chitinophaga pinensis]|uniref:Peptidase U35 phage prohead HK97 n=1 Tax=Chitinophaga pinensis (strain ATCC 43595 / DSM 2588 / LMG 13176 / NBRC 15968 / NCIMB 11800 / UQM 2034) TaxID=485918 RepID=A0A979GSD5_CHIPD|nr:HK97 family phage prohead protease [Chitinophaga pinensis]ACU61353.1 peptidase U35 phage prohead HK97 [Chitinophaga pinensis DSM 2588]
MQSALERKQFNLKALDVDTKTRSVKIAIAELESVDRDNEIFSPTAFDKTIAERGPKGTNEVWHMADHGWSLNSALSKFKELYKEGKYIVGISDYRDTKLWRDTIWPLYEAGDINQHSVGFRTVKSISSEDGSPREILEVTLWEGSAVLWGANPYTPVMGITKSAFKQEDVDDAISRYDKLIKAVKSGRFEEDDSLLMLELKRLQQFTIDLSRISTQPEPGSTEPVKAKDLVEMIQLESELKNTVAGLFK